MRIIKKGHPISPLLTGRCRQCGCEVECGKGEATWADGDRAWEPGAYTVRCPESGCDGVIYLRERGGFVELTPAPSPTPYPRPRTVAEVLTSRQGPGGCCNRYADYSGCSCLEDVQRDERRLVHRPCPECGNSGYRVHPQNGRRVGVRCSLGCRVMCSICSDPDCDNPGGQH